VPAAPGAAHADAIPSGAFNNTRADRFADSVHDPLDERRIEMATASAWRARA
jgi:hypothetical protein